MSHLPELIEALVEPLAIPGAPLGPAVREVRRAPWCPRVLAEALERLEASPRKELDVAHAALFVAGRYGPTLHLETSVYRSGGLQDPATLERLAEWERLADPPEDPFPDHLAPDHLARHGWLLAALLRGLAGSEHPESDPRRTAVLRLLEELTGPHVETLRKHYPSEGDPYHRALLEALAETVAFVRTLLED